jgi:hypothetical protein
MLELIKYDVINGTKVSHPDTTGEVFNNYEELEKFRQKILVEHPDEEVYLTYKDTDSITKKEENGKTES